LNVIVLAPASNKRSSVIVHTLEQTPSVIVHTLEQTLATIVLQCFWKFY